jgi:hypothetical protein
MVHSDTVAPVYHAGWLSGRGAGFIRGPVGSGRRCRPIGAGAAARATTASAHDMRSG